MLLIDLRENESVDSALKRFKKEVEKDGILTEEKKHRFYEKPSESRKKKISTVQRKIEKKDQENETDEPVYIKPY